MVNKFDLISLYRRCTIVRPMFTVVKIRGNAGERRNSWAPKIARPHTAVNGTSRLRGAPSPYSRIPNFVRVPGPQISTLTAGCSYFRHRVDTMGVPKTGYKLIRTPKLPKLYLTPDAEYVTYLVSVNISMWL